MTSLLRERLSVRAFERKVWAYAAPLTVRYALAATLLAVFLVTACKPGDPFRSTGSYPIDVFQEMHYNQSYKAQEPPRLSPPDGAVPVQGGLGEAPLKPDAKDLTDPYPSHAANREDTLTRAALLYKQNCSVCHGLQAKGDGPVGEKFATYGAPRPPAFDSQRMTSLTPGEAYASIAHGAGFMPPFQHLISDEERWVIVALLELDQPQREALLVRVNSLPENERTVLLAQLRAGAP